MSTAVRLVASNPEFSDDVTERQVRRALKPYGLRVRKASLSSIKLEDVRDKAIFVNRKEGNLLIIPYNKMGSIVGNRRRNESPMRFTGVQAGGITFDDAFAKRLVDGYKIMYCREEVAVVVSAGRLLEHLG